MRKFGVLICMLAIAACQSGESQSSDDGEARALEKEVIRIHDEVMPKMNDIRNLEKRFNALLASGDLTTNNTALIQTAVLNLKEADSLMWDWMHNYNVPGEKAGVAEKMKYLASEKVRIETCAEKMLSSINEGEKLIQKLGEQ